MNPFKAGARYAPRLLWPVLFLAGCGGQVAKPRADAVPATEQVSSAQPRLDGGWGDNSADEMEPQAPVDAGAIGLAPTEEPADPGLVGPAGFQASTAEVALNVGETIPLNLYVPDTEGAHPVVVLLHGFQLAPSLYRSYGEHLASWGYVAVLPEMPGGTLGPLGAPNHRRLKEITVSLLDWVVQAAEDPSQPLLGRADPLRLGLAGHSLGGKISFLTATEDTRVAGVFGIDPVDSAGGPGSSDGPDYPSVTPELMDELTMPIALLGETTNATCTGLFCQPCAPENNNFHQYYVHATGPALEIEVLGANHMSFLDDPDCGISCSVCPVGTDEPGVTRALTRRYLTAFFEWVLKEDARFRTYLTGAQHQETVNDGLVTGSFKNDF